MSWISCGINCMHGHLWLCTRRGSYARFLWTAPSQKIHQNLSSRLETSSDHRSSFIAYLWPWPLIYLCRINQVLENVESINEHVTKEGSVWDSKTEFNCSLRRATVSFPLSSTPLSPTSLDLMNFRWEIPCSLENTWILRCYVLWVLGCTSEVYTVEVTPLLPRTSVCMCRSWHHHKATFSTKSFYRIYCGIQRYAHVHKEVLFVKFQVLFYYSCNSI